MTAPADWTDHGHADRVVGAWRARLAGRPMRVVLAEGGDARVRRAAGELAAYGLEVILLDGPENAGAVHGRTSTDLAHGEAGEWIRGRGAELGWDRSVVASRAGDPLFLAAALVAGGAADTAVAGAVHPTPDVLRAALSMIGLRPGANLLSSTFLMVTPSGQPVAFADCGVVPAPDADQLATIAAESADTFTNLSGREARVALLSFSTLGSADHQSVQVVRRALEILGRRRPDLAVDGELQFDAAVVEAVARAKAPDSVVAGQANVLVFPDLGAGNIGYKIAQRWGGCAAFGPILQGLARPMNDVSRGCTADDVVNVGLIGCLQALSRPTADPSLPAMTRGSTHD